MPTKSLPAGVMKKSEHFTLIARVVAPMVMRRGSSECPSV